MTFSEILNIFLGGDLLALVVGVITLRATVRKANADAEHAKADAESVRITNTENATRILVENIVKPLKEELNATREDLQATKKEMASTKREMARLRKAVETAAGCPHSDGCPVLRKLRYNEKESDREQLPAVRLGGEPAVGHHRNKDDSEAGGADGGGQACDSGTVSDEPSARLPIPFG